MSFDRPIALACHPSTRTDAVRAIEVRVSRPADGALALTFGVAGDLASVRVPPPRPPRIATGLWAHTCFEAFVAVADAPAYHEFNFAPSGEWAAFAFHAYRTGAPLADEGLSPLIAVRATRDRLVLEARVRLERLSPAHAQAPLRLGLSAVIEVRDGTRSYWALRHRAGPPDFHHAEARALWLEPPSRQC
jgi:hypothetical protein